MDKEEELVQILGKLSGGRIEDVAEKIIAFFREPAWWEKEFDEKFVVHGSMGAFQDWEKRLEDNTDRQRIIDFIQEYMLKEKP